MSGPRLLLVEDEAPVRRTIAAYLRKRDYEVDEAGDATEALRAMAALAPTLGVRRLYAVCHTVHEKSSHVLEKGGFAREGILRSYMEFPNLDAGGPSDVFCYSMVF